MAGATQTGIVKGDFLSKMAGISFIVGAVLLIVFNLLYPRVSDPTDLQAYIQKVADTRGGFWEIDHLLLAAGIWALMIGVAGIYRSITTGSAAVWARLGFYGVVVGTTLWSVTFALDGFGMAAAAGQWAKASAADKATLFPAVSALGHLVQGIFSMTIIVNWLALAFVGLGIALSTVYPRWLGWVLIILGVLTVVAVGVPQGITGITQTSQLLFTVLSLLTTLWALVIGIWMARKVF